MGMKPPMNEPQGQLCASLAIPGPKDTGPNLPEMNLVSSSKTPDELGFKTLAPNLVAITTHNPG